jgi:hypothetical protein
MNRGKRIHQVQAVPVFPIDPGGNLSCFVDGDPTSCSLAGFAGLSPCYSANYGYVGLPDAGVWQALCQGCSAPAIGGGAPAAEGCGSTVTSGPLVAYCVSHNDVGKWTAVENAFSTLSSRLQKDQNCLNWSATGTNPATVVSQPLLNLELNYIGVATSININGTPSPGIGAATVNQAQWAVVINGQGGFFYGGNIPGLPQGTNIAANSLSGQILILLHELAHVVGGLINDKDAAASINAQNNAAVFANCSKTITGH